MELILYSRPYCHLCEEMLTALKNGTWQKSFDLNIIDVDQDPVLAEKYGAYVPVLLAGEQEICHYYLDSEKLVTYLAKIP